MAVKWRLVRLSSKSGLKGHMRQRERWYIWRKEAHLVHLALEGASGTSADVAKKYGGLCHLRMGFLHMYAVSSPDVAKQVLLQVQDSVFSNRPATIAISYLTYDRANMAFAHYLKTDEESLCHEGV
ncbi:hypothetical protein F2Q70_00042829 [Brassica cretica]|uniref:Uncharacterized protein n=1 Tax=Brassica cretica TaxID=69181 RepID=A0A8S9KLH5_BRACR|nr:hypothetical protein F2Q70_00042829 [Brassica cretica]